MRLPFVSSLLLAATAGAASSAGLDLGWLDCAGLGAGARNWAFACGTNVGVNTLVGSFVAPAGLDYVNGFEARVDLYTEGSTLSPWWDIGDAPHCRPKTSCAFSAVFTAGPFSCFDYFEGTALGAGFYIPFYGGPNRAQIRMGFTKVLGFGPISEGLETYLFKVTISNASTVGLGSCPRCLDDACIAFTYALVTNDQGLGGTDATLTAPAHNAYVTWQGGEATECPVVDPVSARRPSWGSIKSLYR
ncbi:MAG TPA: hypothetical protein VGK89_08415 [Candidatus Eisenbacteria bacterium]|jgi:hypothetical protein